MSKVRINREDANRVLLTELLPYEVPMLFSNDGFYEIVKSGGFDYFAKKLRGRKPKYGIPFNFEVRKAALGDTRLLSVIHPFNQVDFIDFYKKYDSLILHQCSKSPFSLRKVSKIAKYCYSPNLVFEEDEHKNQEVEVVPDVLDKETKVLKSYFTYEPIDLIYKFYDRREYQRLEQKYNLLLECDVTKCFYNIYTHSITWAVKDKESAKRNASKMSFENQFDKLMQHANYNETNGIVVGPEVSRIFAEIILQQVDANTLSVLENVVGLKFGVDFEVRRYVDDYFIFANDENHIDMVFKVLKKELKEYKLYVNESKTNRKTTPFITNQAVGKRELNNLLNTLYDKLILTSEDKTETGEILTKITINDLRNPYRISQSFIRDFQCVVKRNDLTYDSLSKDIVRFSKTTIAKILKNKKIGKDIDLFENLALLVLDICFYAYSLNITSSTTFKLAQLIVLLCKFLKDKPERVRHNIYTKINQEIDFAMTIFQRKTKKGETNIETLNLLIALKKLDEPYFLSESKIFDLFSISEEDDYNKFNYFHYITLLYYIDNNPKYGTLREQLLKSINKKFINEHEPFVKAEYTMLFFDLICCPYVSDEYKKKLMVNSHYVKDNTEAEAEIAKIAIHKMWFMDWDKDIDLERVLKKKEWASTY